VVLPAQAAGLQLALVVAAHAARGRLQRGALRGRDGVERGLQLVARELQRGDARGIQAIESLRVFQHRSIAARLHVGQDRGDAFLDRRVRLFRPMAQLGELGFEVGGGGIELADLDRHGAVLVEVS